MEKREESERLRQHGFEHAEREHIEAEKLIMKMRELKEEFKRQE